MNQNVLLRAAVSALSAFVLSGCHTMLVPEEIKARGPDRVATRVALINVNHGPCDIGSLDRSVLSGDAIARPTGDEVIAGFNNILLRGADPFPCNRQRSQVYRGVVHFNLDDLRGTIIDRATLRFDMRNGLPWRLGGSASLCQLAVARATEDWVTGYQSGPDGTTIRAVPFRRNDFNNHIVGSVGFDQGVTRLERGIAAMVQDWVLGSRPNFGVVIHQEEPEGAMAAANDRSCTTVFSNFTLELSIRRFVPVTEP